MFDQLDIVEERYEQLNELLSDPDVVSDSNKLREYSKEQSDLQKTVDVYRQYKQNKEDIDEIVEMLSETSDKEEVDMLKADMNELKDTLPGLEEELKMLLIPKDPNDDKTLWLKSERLPAVTKLLSLLEIYIVCTHVSVKDLVIKQE